jgi:restriction system protein
MAKIGRLSSTLPEVYPIVILNRREIQYSTITLTKYEHFMKQYKRIMAGPRSIYAEKCFEEGFIGTDFLELHDLTGNLPEAWQVFNLKYREVWLKENPGKSMRAAGLACGMLWTVSKGINKGDIVLCPDGDGGYFVGEVIGDYYFAKGETLPHRRNVDWFDSRIQRNEMSEALKGSTGVPGTVSDITKHSEEIDAFIHEWVKPQLISNDPTVEDATVFALETHLEHFLIQNWENTELAKEYDIYIDEVGNSGQQFQTDTGPLDILAISKDETTLLVIELKKGRASDSVVGQIQRYMGYIKDEVATNDQRVKGLIIALEDDQRIRRALSVAKDIEFYRYEVTFKLFKASI